MTNKTDNFLKDFAKATGLIVAICTTIYLGYTTGDEIAKLHLKKNRNVLDDSIKAYTKKVLIKSDNLQHDKLATDNYFTDTTTLENRNPIYNFANIQLFNSKRNVRKNESFKKNLQATLGETILLSINYHNALKTILRPSLFCLRYNDTTSRQNFLLIELLDGNEMVKKDTLIINTDNIRCRILTSNSYVSIIEQGSHIQIIDPADLINKHGLLMNPILPKMNIQILCYLEIGQ